MTDYPFIFDAPIVAHDFGRYTYSVVFLPENMHAELPLKQYPRLRVEVLICGVAFSAAWTPTHGRWYLLLSKRRLKQCGLDCGEWTVVQFAIADQSAVDVPKTLQLALDNDPNAKAIWQTLTPGKRRGFAYRVASAKTAPTQTKRALEIVETITAQQFN